MNYVNTLIKNPKPEDKKHNGKNYDRIKFSEKLATAKKNNPFVYDSYVEISKSLLDYQLHSRCASSGESFRIHRKRFAKITIAGKRLKVYLAIKPDMLKETKIPYMNVSAKKSLEDVPVGIKIHSKLALRRVLFLIKNMLDPIMLKKEDIKPETQIDE
jgi:predicted transport protein